MRSRSGSSFSTLLLSLPLVGVPLMAMFGVPQFVPVVASSVNDQPTARSKPTRSTRIGESLVPAMLSAVDTPHSGEMADADSLDDLFRPPSESRQKGPVQRSSKPARSPDTPGLFAQEPRTSTARPAKLQAVRNPTETHLKQQQPSPEELRLFGEKTVDGLTWQNAVSRLNELGIHEFRLEPGQQMGEFYFACEFSPDANARITRRFESEASEPLKAVALVLRQIDSWMRNQAGGESRRDVAR